MIRDDTQIEVMFKTNVFNCDGHNVAFAKDFFGDGVKEGVGGEFLSDLKMFAFHDGHHHAHHIMMTKHTMRKDHVNDGVDTISYFREQAFRKNIQNKNHRTIGPRNNMIMNPEYPFNRRHVAIFFCAFAL